MANNSGKDLSNYKYNTNNKLWAKRVKGRQDAVDNYTRRGEKKVRSRQEEMKQLMKNNSKFL